MVCVKLIFRQFLCAKLVILTIFAWVLLTSHSYSYEIFSENYDAINSGWNCSNAVPSGWSGKANCPAPSTYNGVTRYAGEVSNGGRSGNSLKLWRRNGIWTDYHGYLDKSLNNVEFNQKYKEIYVRWNIKIPPEWDANLGGSGTMKLNRAYFGTTAGATSPEWYLDIKGSSFKNGKFSFYNTAAGDVWYSSQTVSQIGINDGKWHSLEWRLKLNSTTGSTDGGFQLFVDGKAITICDGIGQRCSTNQIRNTGASTGHYFTSLNPPAIGNLSGGTWNFPTSGWYALEFDDYAVSRSYIGSDTGSSAPAPAPSEPALTPPSTSDPSFTLLSETWEQRTFQNWQFDFVQGNTTIETSPVYNGNYAVMQKSSSPGNFVHIFGDHPYNSGTKFFADDVTLEEHYFLPSNFQFPSSDLKLWLMNSFVSWNAGYSTAEGQSKPHTWAPYYISISVNGSGQPFGQLTRADGLGGTGVLWQNLGQNVGSSVSLNKNQWNKIKFRLKLNDLGMSNGIFELWVNDQLKCSYNNVNFRGTYSGTGWNHLMMSMHANPSHPQSQSISRDNITLTSGQTGLINIQPPLRLRVID